VQSARSGYDGVLMFNYRSDRAREILTALLDARFDGFNRARVVKFAMAVGMVDYSAALAAARRHLGRSLLCPVARSRCHNRQARLG
jgi:bisphosphoglycerate-independent phosphoglycerate mutase (AlkP superfamily)